MKPKSLPKSATAVGSEKVREVESDWRGPMFGQGSSRLWHERLKNEFGGVQSTWFLVAILALVAFAPSPLEAQGIWGVDSASDNDYVLDLIAIKYLPSASRAVRKAREVYWCGTPVLQFMERLTPDASIPEAEMLARARRLQAHHAPEELASGLAVSETVCKTPGCRGMVPVRDLLDLPRVVAR